MPGIPAISAAVIENRCLVPVNSFAEYAPEPNPATGKKDVVWFALDDDRPLFAFAGMLLMICFTTPRVSPAVADAIPGSL